MTEPLRVEYRKVETLVPYARNPRTHSDEQIARIAASLVEFGWTNPILVDGANGIIAGHGRLAAARKLGLTEVPVIELSHLTPAQKRAYVIADNRLALDAGWDEEMLALELAELSEAGFDLALTGMGDDEIERLLDEIEADIQPADASTADEDDQARDDEDIPAPPKIVISRPGDVWLLGEHRLICADSSDRAAMQRLMAGEQAALLFTSPPYANQRNYTTGGIADWDALMQGVFGAAMSVMREDGQMLVNLGLVHRDGEWQPYWDGWIEWMRGQGWRRFGWYVWDQGVTVPGDWVGRLAPRHEFLFHFNRAIRKPNKIVPCKYAGQDVHLRADGTSTGGLRSKEGARTGWCHTGLPTQEFRIPDSVITVTRQRGPIDRDREIDHPAVFPIGLPKFVMEAYTDEGEIVFEPFSGSGTTILAGEACGRCVRAAELAPEYVDVAVIRWMKTHPDRAPVLETTGQSWAAVKAEREPEGVTATYGDVKKRLSDVFNDRMAKMENPIRNPWGRNRK
ncbi:site-specific DNA-methyltransferase [Sulfurivermis fontis]|uniref:site-specific DNA-methyltransferase n=1 Tax=Sulfurivermis fontis TaxID=1972068 RepID=UPI000FD7F2BD|nr:site-specific DNA-methyltransferase [Sulfurivermis fontis]